MTKRPVKIGLNLNEILRVSMPQGAREGPVGLETFVDQSNDVCLGQVGDCLQQRVLSLNTF